MELSEFFRLHPRAAIAFSGGVDSAYLLCEAIRCDASVRAYYVDAAFQPAFERRDAERLAGQLGADLKILTLDVLSDPMVTANPKNRCYYCKKNIFRRIQEAAASDGFDLILDGTNASDDAGDRPGMAALRELSVRSPLRECGLTKARIRELSKEAGLFTWNKPAYACLATRIPTGVPIDAASLRQIEAAEDYLFELGFTDFRVRIYEGAARLQLPDSQIPLLLTHRDAIAAELSRYFKAVFFDLGIHR